MQLVRGNIQYPFCDVKINSKILLNRSFDISDASNINVNKRNLGLQGIEYVDLLGKQNHQTKQNRTSHNFFVNIKDIRMRCSLVKWKFLNSIFIPNNTKIYTDDFGKEKEYDANNIEYYVTNSEWQIKPFDYHSGTFKNDYEKKFSNWQEVMFGLQYLIDPDNEQVKNNYAVNTIFSSSLDPIHSTHFKNNFSNSKEVWCVIEDDKVIGLSDLGSKDNLESYFS